jgi:hypothetical protein
MTDRLIHGTTYDLASSLPILRRGCTVTVVHFPAVFINVIHPLQLAISFCLACGVLILLIWPIWVAAHAAVSQGQQMHQIPCANCCFFTGDYALKCTVHPKSALSAAAIDCPDYRPTSHFGA